MSRLTTWLQLLLVLYEPIWAHISENISKHVTSHELKALMKLGIRLEGGVHMVSSPEHGKHHRI